MMKRKDISLVIFPTMSCLILVFYLTIAIIETHPAYGGRSLAFAFALLIIWVLSLFLDQKREQKQRLISCSVVPFAVIAILLSVYMCFTIWGSGYLSLAPFEALDNGLANKDTLFHSAIAESFKRSILPSTLLNDEVTVHYHTFSHFCISVLSGILGIPAFIAYNFLYPIVFIPLYLFSQLYAISSAKKFFHDTGKIGLFDLIVVLLINTGMSYSKILEYNGYRVSSSVISESFMIACTIMFYILGLGFVMLKEGGRKKELYRWLYIPVGIFLISWAKIFSWQIRK